MTDTTVTPELLLFMAKKVLGHAYECDHKILCRQPGEAWLTDYRPHIDDAQFGRLVVWAAMNGYLLSHRYHDKYDVSVYEDERWRFSECEVSDSTPDSIRAAVVVAICRALNYREAASD